MPYKFSFYFTFCCLSLLLNLKVTAQTWGNFNTIFKNQDIEVELRFKEPVDACNTNTKFKYEYKVTGQYLDYDYFVNWDIDYEDCDGYTVTEHLNLKIGEQGGAGYKDGEFVKSIDFSFLGKITKSSYNVKSSYSAIFGTERKKKLTPYQQQENAIWQYSQTFPTVSNVRYYLNSYPNGVYFNEAKALMLKAYYEQAKGEDLYKSSEICTSIPSDTAYKYWKQYAIFPQNQASSLQFQEASTRIFIYEMAHLKQNSKAAIQQQLDLITTFNTNFPYNNCFDELKAKANLLSIYLNSKKQPSAYISNLFIPGRGNLNINKDLKSINEKIYTGLKLPYLTTVVVWGSLFTAGYFYYQGFDNYNKYSNTENPAEWDGYLNLANDNRTKGNIMLGIGLGIWVLDYANIIYKKHKLKSKLTSIDKNVVNFNYYNNSFSVSYSYKF